MESAIASLTAGLTPDQVHTLEKQNHDVEIYACSIAFSTLAVLAVAVRVTSRHMKKVAIGFDDILIIAALVCPSSSLASISNEANCPIIKGHYARADNIHMYR